MVTFGANRDRLLRIKAHYDPDNIFHSPITAALQIAAAGVPVRVKPDSLNGFAHLATAA
jgi:hypothetical protein